MGKKSNYTKMQAHINGQEVKHTKAFTAFLGLFNQEELAKNGSYGMERKESAFPITEQIIELGLDRVYTTRALKNLESKGNVWALELIQEHKKSIELNLSYEDLLQEFRLKLMELESLELLGLEERAQELTINKERKEWEQFKIACTDGEQEGQFFKELFASVTSTLWKEKRRAFENKRISFEVEMENGESKLVSMLNRKALAEYADAEKIVKSTDFKRFEKYLKSITMESLRAKRVNILHGLVKGYTYRDISDFYKYSISTIGEHVKAIKEAYKWYFGIHKSFAVLGCKNVRFIGYKMDKKSKKLVGHTQELLKVSPMMGYRYTMRMLNISMRASKDTTNYHVCNYKYKYDLFFSIGADEQIKALENRISTENLELIRVLNESPTEPKKADFERSEKLYSIRQGHCKKRSIRSRVLNEERAIRQELERIAKYEKPQEESGELKIRKYKGMIRIYYGKTFIHELPIAK